MSEDKYMTEDDKFEDIEGIVTNVSFDEGWAPYNIDYPTLYVLIKDNNGVLYNTFLNTYVNKDGLGKDRVKLGNMLKQLSKTIREGQKIRVKVKMENLEGIIAYRAISQYKIVQ